MRRHELRHVLCDDGHSRHVVVHWSAGSHVSVDEHQPHPGASSEHVQTSVAAEHTEGAEMLKCDEKDSLDCGRAAIDDGAPASRNRTSVGGMGGSGGLSDLADWAWWGFCLGLVAFFELCQRERIAAGPTRKSD